MFTIKLCSALIAYFPWACLSTDMQQQVVESGCQKPILAFSEQDTVTRGTIHSYHRDIAFIGCADNNVTEIF